MAVALDVAVGRKVDMTAMGSGSSARPIVHLESNGGTRTAHFAGEVTNSPTKKVDFPESVPCRGLLEGMQAAGFPLLENCGADFAFTAHSRQIPPKLTADWFPFSRWNKLTLIIHNIHNSAMLLCKWWAGETPSQGAQCEIRGYSMSAARAPSEVSTATLE